MPRYAFEITIQGVKEAASEEDLKRYLEDVGYIVPEFAIEWFYVEHIFEVPDAESDNE